MSFVFDADRVGPWVCEKSGGRYGRDEAAIGVERDGKLLVGVRYEGFTGSNIALHWRIDDPSATSKRFFWMIFDYPFNQLKVKRITAVVSSNNKHCAQLVERLGFYKEAVIGEHFPDADAIIYAMRDCRWLDLGKRYGRNS